MRPLHRKPPGGGANRELVRVRPDDFNLLLAAVAALGVVLVLARQIVYGVGLAGDSLEYLAVANNVLTGKGLTYLTGAPYTWWPPLYPLLLAGAGLMIDPLEAAGPLNAVIFGLTIFAVGHYLRKRLDSRFPVVWACLAMALSIPLADLSSWALSDPAFILLTTLALIRADAFLTEGRLANLVWAGVFSALAWQCRYLGVCVPVAVGMLLLVQPGASPRQRIGRAAGFSLIAGCPMALWLLRNYLTTGMATGPVLRVDYPLPLILDDISAGLWRWLSFKLPMVGRLSSGVPSVFSEAGLALPLLVTAGMLAAVALARPAQRLSGYLFGGFAITYVLAVVAALAWGRGPWGFEPRYLLPIYVPLLIVAALALDRFFGHGRRANLVSAILMLCLCGWLVGQIAPNVRDVRRFNADDFHAGYHGQPWADSATLQYIRDHPLSGEVYSNHAYLVFLHNAGAASYHMLPRSRSGGYVIDAGSAAFDQDRERWESWLAGAPTGAYVVFFHDVGVSSIFDYGIAAAQVSAGLEFVAELSDGVIYKVNPSSPPSFDSDVYRSAYESISGGGYGAPAAQSIFDLYLSPDGKTLVYFKEPCAAGDTRKPFFLHVVPVDTADLPAHVKPPQVFEGWNFAFPHRGAVLNGGCLVIMALPDYRISHLRTGQYLSGKGNIWDETVLLPDRARSDSP